MTQKVTTFVLVAAGLATTAAGIIFMRASTTYSKLRNGDASTSVDELNRASDSANFWFIVLMGAVAIFTILLAHSIALKRRDENKPAA